MIEAIGPTSISSVNRPGPVAGDKAGKPVRDKPKRDGGPQERGKGRGKPRVGGNIDEHC